jgi:prevent-host-death family protein
MPQYSTHEAKTQLSRLLDLVLAGEEVVIARRSQPIAKLIPFRPTAKPATQRPVGTPTSDPVELAEDAFAPLDEHELATWGL